MLNIPDKLSINPAIAPVSKLLPVLQVDSVASPTHELYARATQFAKGHEYVAHVLSRLDNKTHLVKIDNALLKMELGTAAQTGQTLMLRYVQDAPVPTFAFNPAQPQAGADDAEISTAATLINKFLKEAESAGASVRHEAVAVVTTVPKNPQMLAQDLRQALSNSGLFYESHLSEAIQGHRSLSALMQEPQNQHHMPISHLAAQQLAVLENQRISWHGEIWPGQKMDWDVDVQDKPGSEHGAQALENQDENKQISSEITLHLPNLGKVTAKLDIAEGRMHINLFADLADTIEVFKGEAQRLSKAVESNGIALDALTVTSYG